MHIYRYTCINTYIRMYIHTCIPEEHSKKDKSIVPKFELTVAGNYLHQVCMSAMKLCTKNDQ